MNFTPWAVSPDAFCSSHVPESPYITHGVIRCLPAGARPSVEIQVLALGDES